MLWLNFILGLILFSLICFKLITKYYHTPPQRKIILKSRIKLNYNIYDKSNIIIIYHCQRCFTRELNKASDISRGRGAEKFR